MLSRRLLSTLRTVPMRCYSGVDYPAATETNTPGIARDSMNRAFPESKRSAIPDTSAIAGEAPLKMKGAPGWNELLASDSEAMVKAEREPRAAVADLQRDSIKAFSYAANLTAEEMQTANLQAAAKDAYAAAKRSGRK